MTITAQKPSLSNNKYPKDLISDLKEQLELFPANPIINSQETRTKRFMGFTFLFICASALLYLSYNAFKYSKHPTKIEEISLIKADHTPIRVIPTDPGGVQVLNQDKLIYNNLQDPSFKPNKKPTAQIEEESKGNQPILRSPKLYKKTETPKGIKPAKVDKIESKRKASAPIKNPFEVLGKGDD
jgi:hypothetical protein